MGNLSIEDKENTNYHVDYFNYEDKSFPSKPPEAKKKRIRIPVVIAILCLILAALGWVMYYFIIRPAPASVSEAYAESKDSAYEDIYDRTYATSRDSAEKNFHVSNKLEISLGNIREIQKLEVLNVSEVEYQTPPEEDSSLWGKAEKLFKHDVTSCLEVPGSGVFTVDLKASEFIIDSIHQHVIVRVPNPELANFKINFENVQLLFFEDDGIFKESAKVGVDTAMKQLQDAELTMMQRVNNDQELFKKAQISTESILTNIICQLNPNMKELTVDVEFYD